MNNILITGSNRGIGLGIIKALINNKQSNVTNIIATCRKPEEAKDLKDLANSCSNIHILKLDVSDLSSYPNLASDVSKIVGSEGLNTLINNAGVAEKFLRIGYLKSDSMMNSYLINTVAPTMLTKELLPLLKTGAEGKGAAVVNISSVLGSISLNDSGGYYPYRCSKAALNAATKSLSLDLKSYKITAVALHPGWVKTDMGGEKAPMSVQDATTQIVNTLINLKPEQTGSFLNFDGTPLAW